MRDLVRARADLVDDRRPMMQRINALLMRHGQVWRAAEWTGAYRDRILGRRFAEPTLQRALDVYTGALMARDAELDVLEADLALWAGREPLASTVARLGCAGASAAQPRILF